MLSPVLLFQSSFLIMAVVLVLFLADLLEECDFLVVDGGHCVCVREPFDQLRLVVDVALLGTQAATARA